jgi:hypothetical protein
MLGFRSHKLIAGTARSGVTMACAVLMTIATFAPTDAIATGLDCTAVLPNSRLQRTVDEGGLSIKIWTNGTGWKCWVATSKASTHWWIYLNDALSYQDDGVQTHGVQPTGVKVHLKTARGEAATFTLW